MDDLDKKNITLHNFRVALKRVRGMRKRDRLTYYHAVRSSPFGGILLAASSVIEAPQNAQKTD